MFQQLLQYFLNKKRRVYKPVKHTFFRDPAIAKALHEEGYYVAGFLGETDLQLLFNLYNKLHQLKSENGGAFFGVFSKSTEYKKEVNEAVDNILAPTCNRYFKHSKSIVNTFVIKTPGPASQIPIHQDGAAIDEERYSSINIWIPLQEINSVNGAMYIIPRSHHIFSPYRCATTEPITKNIEEFLYPYFIPVHLKPGQLLFFDSRMFHYSPANLSDQNRVAVVSRICPKEASIIAYYKDLSSVSQEVEMWRCPDDYLVYSDAYNDNLRPVGCELVNRKTNNIHPLTIEEFEELREKYGIKPQNLISPPISSERNFIKEPILQKS